MDVSGAITQLEGAMSHQVALAGGDPAVETAAEALLSALGPAVRQMALGLAEQTAVEVGAQLPDHEVEVTLREGEPTLNVRPSRMQDTPGPADAEARVTLRLPEDLKRLVEEEAETIGDSVNAWIVKALSSRARAERTKGPGRRMSGEFQT